MNSLRFDRLLVLTDKGGRRRREGILTGAQTLSVSLLLRQVNMPKKLNLDALAREATERLPGAILGAWKV
jgi:hypothetical protein